MLTQGKVSESDKVMRFLPKNLEWRLFFLPTYPRAWRCNASHLTHYIHFIYQLKFLKQSSRSIIDCALSTWHYTIQ